jgi:hypothetical protein
MEPQERGLQPQESTRFNPAIAGEGDEVVFARVPHKTVDGRSAAFQRSRQGGYTNFEFFLVHQKWGAIGQESVVLGSL